MIRVLLISLLLCAGPLASQHAADDVPPLRSGTRVRVFMQNGPPAGAHGLLVSGTRDTLGIAFPLLGLLRLSAADLQRLETPAVTGPTWKYTAIDPRLGLPEVQQTPGRPGAPVRILAGAGPRSVQRLHGFTADSVYLFARGQSTAVARADIRSLQVSVERDRGRGAIRGGAIGAVAGALLMLYTIKTDDGDGGWVPGEIQVGWAAGMGSVAGAAAGWLLAPPRWDHVPVHQPRR